MNNMGVMKWYLQVQLRLEPIGSSCTSLCAMYQEIAQTQRMLTWKQWTNPIARNDKFFCGKKGKKSTSV